MTKSGEGLRLRSRRSAACFYWEFSPCRPLSPGTHVDSHPRKPQQIPQGEVYVARLGGAVAVGDDVAVRSNPLGSVAGAELCRVLPHVAKSYLSEIRLPVVADRPWDM